MWQHVELSEQIRPWDTLACCWDVKQPSNKSFVKKAGAWPTCDQKLLWLVGCLREDAAVETKATLKVVRTRVKVCSYTLEVCLFVGCLTSQLQASVSQGWICEDNFTCCHTEIEVADQTFYLTQSQYTDTGPTSPSADPITPLVWLDP